MPERAVRAAPPALRVHCSKCGYTVSKEAAIACLTVYCPPRSHFRKVGGFISIPPLPLWAYVGFALVLSLAFGALQTHRIKGYKQELAAVKALGAEQEKQTKLQIERDRKEKERADHEAKRRFANLDAQYRRLRDSGAGVLPAAPSGAGGAAAETLCFNRARLADALGKLIAGFSGIAQDGDRAIVGLDIARAWAQAPSRAQ